MSLCLTATLNTTDATTIQCVKRAKDKL